MNPEQAQRMKKRTSKRTATRRRERLNSVAARNSPWPAPRKSCAMAERPGGRARVARRRRTLLVPIDFTGSSLKALDYALLLAKRLNATVTLLHVLESLYGEGFLDASARLKARSSALADARLKLNLLAASRLHWRVPLECVVRHGHVEYEIFRYAEAASVHLVVLGRKVRHTLSRFVFGSVTARVMETAPCAVVVVPEREGSLAPASGEPPVGPAEALRFEAAPVHPRPAPAQTNPVPEEPAAHSR